VTMRTDLQKPPEEISGEMKIKESIERLRIGESEEAGLSNVSVVKRLIVFGKRAVKREGKGQATGYLVAGGR
jgi:hypothetical protein